MRHHVTAFIRILQPHHLSKNYRRQPSAELLVGRTRDIKQAGFDNLAAGEARSAE